MGQSNTFLRNVIGITIFVVMVTAVGHPHGFLNPANPDSVTNGITNLLQFGESADEDLATTKAEKGVDQEEPVVVEEEPVSEDATEEVATPVEVSEGEENTRGESLRIFAIAVAVFALIATIGCIGFIYNRQHESRKTKKALAIGEAHDRRRKSRKTKKALASQRSTEWAILKEIHGTTSERWLEYEIDIMKVLSFPSMVDPHEPLTRAFHEAMSKANRLKPSDAYMREADSSDSPYSQAVESMQAAFFAAETNAKTRKWSAFTPDETRRLRQAQELLAIASSGGSSPSERQVAYKRALKNLEGLVAVPERALGEIEGKVALLLAT